MGDKHGKFGRPRSEKARTAILHAVDDLVVEIGYGAVTIKSIAERAGVSRQTIYRWWSTKAEILLEAIVIDARDELDVPVQDNSDDNLVAYLDALITFLVSSPAGIAYRSLVGASQYDPSVANLLAENDVLGESAVRIIKHSFSPHRLHLQMKTATAFLVGPIFFCILSGRNPDELDTVQLTQNFLRVAVDAS
ncbi:TetR/AcrR family transcriptional regulator [Bifidobacterium crudilactis]|uniref:TetR/AcrR family transcriptional regulator n=1 Tax=Bifidobacterium crudilactis TaxID=327277 RepID=UPI002352819B|nr:TetR/AcrR family transcriptional regulator [Bifidobacterium crudilactis]MCI1218475.1 TetR/AcrR family transcriptional regulator [Bifidobacterium crudilactis]